MRLNPLFLSRSCFQITHTNNLSQCKPHHVQGQSLLHKLHWHPKEAQESWSFKRDLSTIALSSLMTPLLSLKQVPLIFHMRNQPPSITTTYKHGEALRWQTSTRALTSWLYSKAEVGGKIKNNLSNISQHPSPCPLVMLKKISRVKTSKSKVLAVYGDIKYGFPSCVSPRDLKLLQSSMNETKYDLMVTKDGNTKFVVLQSFGHSRSQPTQSNSRLFPQPLKRRQSQTFASNVVLKKRERLV
jgi:hypothetical protein